MMKVNLKAAQCLVLASVLGLSACATGAKMADVPSANAAVPAGKGRIVVYRTSILGAAIQPMVSVDGAEKERCKPQGAFIVDVAPGSHTVSATTEVNKTAYVSVEEGQTAYVKCKIGFGVLVGEPSFSIVPEAEGKAESSKMPLLGQF